ncbi:MAG TPA: hypothetical protein P5026_03615 [Kiritimatiellia bacterium]|nr:hypothetical protein [Kiritimatiellia bacterium]HRU70607.1 hypothetical protein [Kiritimatiellia bacterium]
MQRSGEHLKDVDHEPLASDPDMPRWPSATRISRPALSTIFVANGCCPFSRSAFGKSTHWKRQDRNVDGRSGLLLWKKYRSNTEWAFP